MSERLRILLALPPLTQLNTPYPATAYLSGYLRQQGYEVAQVDLGLELVLALFSRDGLRRLFDAVEAMDDAPDEAWDFVDQRAQYERTIEATIRFLQGRDPTLAQRIASRAFLPEGPRFDELDDLDAAFGAHGVQDRARYLATRYLDDLADLVRCTVSPHFGFTRYAERLALAATSFEPMAEALAAPVGLVDELLLSCLESAVTEHRPELVGFSVPFPGNLYGALRCGQWLGEHHPDVTRVLGGGYPNTELRSLREPRLFDAVDFVTLDDGERPFTLLLEHLEGGRDERTLKRTFRRIDGDVVYLDGDEQGDVPHAALPAPDYRGLRLDHYLSVLSVPNPMHRLWSDGRWAKLTIAHGCYWKQCSFCDVTLDYISRYDVAPAAALADRVDEVLAHTGQSGVHFVDEAAPPAAMRDLAIELLARGTVVSWWTNIRFEKAFTRDLCRLLVASGLIAVSGGLEVASDRLLARMKKGVTVAQVARVAAAFADAGALVHAYLMYGFPTQTTEETVDALEHVRQMVGHGIVHSGFWHRFAMTAHSPVGVDPASFGVEAIPLPDDPFAVNDVQHLDPTGADHDMLGRGLDHAMYNYLHGVGLDRPAHRWFDEELAPTRVPPDRIEAALLEAERPDAERLRQRLVWLGGPVDWLVDPETDDVGGVRAVAAGETLMLELDESVARWLGDVLEAARPETRTPRSLSDALAEFPGERHQAGAFLESWAWAQLREHGLVLV